eukprot:1069363-Pyramimonas_sp.AAC.1
MCTVQEVYPAGTPADGSDGSRITAQSADVSDMTSSGVTPIDLLYATDPWRNQAQQMPIRAGLPAAFAPMSRAATPF